LPHGLYVAIETMSESSIVVTVCHLDCYRRHDDNDDVIAITMTVTTILPLCYNQLVKCAILVLLVTDFMILPTQQQITIIAVSLPPTYHVGGFKLPSELYAKCELNRS
jgi:hypothetical protein